MDSESSTLIDPASGPSSGDPSETFLVLGAEAQRHSSGPLAELLAAQALRVTVGADFAVVRDALEALLRRVAAARRDDLVILERPAGRSSRGRYRVGRRRSRERRYEVWLESLNPPEGSCSCLDFAKASLGWCKHLLVVVADRLGKSTAPAGRQGEAGPRLRWNPIRPLTGRGDWLERVHWDERGRAAPAGVDERRVRDLFSHLPRTGPRTLRRAWADDPARRLEVVELLCTWVAGQARRRATETEPALLPLLQRERERLQRAVQQGVPPRELGQHLAGLKQKLFPYQREGVRRFVAEGRLLLADDMGLGKTAQAIAAAHVLFGAGRIERALVVVPAALKPQWAREWQHFTDLELKVIEGGPAERQQQFRQCRRGVLLANYEQVLRDLPLMLRFRPDLVVLDEAQRIKNWATKTATFVKRLESPWRLVLTGTPMENRLDELASILEWVDETALEPRWRLPSWHAVRADGRREVVGARNLETLRARLQPCLLRRVRSEVLTQLPPRRDSRVSVPLTEAQREAHDDLREPIARLVATAARRPLTQAEFLRLMGLFTQQRILCNGVAQRDFEEVWPDLARARRPTEALLAGLGSPKLLELRELLSGLVVSQERKVVIFSQWRRMLRLASWAVSDLLAAAGTRAAFFTGEESQRRRTQNLVDFHDDPAVRVLFATDAGGVGLNLQRAASCCINLDLPWNPAVLEQRIGRIYRFGQPQPVEIYNLVAETGIEARIAGLVSDKKVLFTGLFDGTSDEVAFERAGSFLARIQQLVESPAIPLAEAADAPDADAEDVECDEQSRGDSTPDASEPAFVDGRSTSAPAGAPDQIELDPLSSLLRQVEVRSLPGGRIAIEAPAAAAAALAGLLRDLSRAISPAGAINEGAAPALSATLEAG